MLSGIILQSLISQKLIIDDGPYIFREQDSFKVKRIFENKLSVDFEKNLMNQNFDLLPFEISVREPAKRYDSFVFNDVNKIAAISDIHGQYDVMIKLLQNSKIIDQNLKWSFGDGHFVIVGDVFDRGDAVNEILWFIYELEAQAEAQGGKVHFLLGNHELMVLSGDNRYIHKKYLYTTGITKTKYDDLYSKESVLGQWLRQKPISIKLNDITFVHGGFSDEVLAVNMELDSLNYFFADQLIGVDPSTIVQDSIKAALYLESGPLWYRGYFENDELNVVKVDQILEQLDSKHIVVGHTSLQGILPLYDQRIFMIDSSIKFGKKGEVLLWENGEFYRGQILGESIKI